MEEMKLLFTVSQSSCLIILRNEHNFVYGWEKKHFPSFVIIITLLVTIFKTEIPTPEGAFKFHLSLLSGDLKQIIFKINMQKDKANIIFTVLGRI